MDSTTSQKSEERRLAMLVERCQKLFLPCVRLSGDSVEIVGPTHGPSAEAFLRAPVFAQLVRGWLSRPPVEGAAELVPLFTGCWLLPLDGEDRAEDTTVAVFVTGAAVRSGPFGVVCASAGVTPGAIIEKAEPWVQWGMGNPDRLQTILNWVRDDMEAAEHKDGLLKEFSDKLIQSYEETHVLFRIMRFIASTGSPRQQVQLVCNQIQQILPFRWVVALFKDQERVEASLRGHMVFGGAIPPLEGEFRGELLALIDSQSEDSSWTRVLSPSDSVLARLVGSEVVCDPITYGGAVVGAIFAGNKSGPDLAIASPEIQFMDAVADFLGTFHENAVRFAEQQALFMGMLRALTGAIDAKDPYTRGHSERVAFLCGAIAGAMGQSDEAVERARVAGLVHDIGKIGVPEAILCKAGKLTEEEFAAIKKHPEVGHRILHGIEALEDVLPGVLHHHERWDGRGYPAGLKGEKIPMIARVIGLADTFDAMSSTRSYRPAVPRDDVIREIERGAGTQFDPRIVEAFRAVELAGYDELLGRRPDAEAGGTGGLSLAA